MKTIKVKANLSLGYPSGCRDAVLDIDVPDSIDEDKLSDWIEENVQAWANNYINISWEQI